MMSGDFYADGKSFIEKFHINFPGSLVIILTRIQFIICVNINPSYCKTFTWQTEQNRDYNQRVCYGV